MRLSRPEARRGLQKEIDRQDLARRLKEAREYLELSQDEVAGALKVPRSAISLIETGQRRVEALELQRLAEIYQRPIGYFTGKPRRLRPFRTLSSTWPEQPRN